jgi:hypothetical protein
MSILASRAEKSEIVIADILGNCLPNVRASEAYLSESAAIPLF